MAKYDRRSGNSYRKAIYTDGYGSRSHRRRWSKRQASKAVRRYQGEIPDGMAYKKLYSSYAICDFIIDCAFGPENEYTFWGVREPVFEFNGNPTRYFSK